MSGAVLGALQEIQGQHRLRCKLFRDSRIVGTEIGCAVVMSNPERAQRFAGLVVQRNDQVFDDLRLSIAQGSERALRSRYPDRRAGIQAEPARAGITGRVCAFVRSQRPADRRPVHDRLARVVLT